MDNLQSDLREVVGQTFVSVQLFSSNDVDDFPFVI
jgi:hypothetical protein